MKFIVAVDCDGCACVVGEAGKSLSISRDFRFACEQATREADAAARALFDAGAARVIVWDNHGSGANLHFDRLDRRCEIALGSGFPRRWPGLDDTFAGAVMIGYHAMAGAGGVLAHTYSPGAYRCVTVNGQPVGEMAIDAAVAGELGVPVVFVASDDRGCDEARRCLPWVETAVTKHAVGVNAAHSVHPAEAVERIARGVRAAVDRLSSMQPFALPTPADVVLRFRHPLQALKARLRRRGWRLAGSHALATRVERISEIRW